MSIAEMTSWPIAIKLGGGYWKGFAPSFGTSFSAVIGFALVTATLNGMLAVVTGFNQSFGIVLQGENQRFMIAKAGAPSEAGSSLLFDEVHVGVDAQEIDERSEEFIVLAHDMPLLREYAKGTLPIRGVTGSAFKLRPEIRVTEGRMFRPGHAEAIVGEAAVRTFRGLELGSDLRYDSSLAGPISLQVVGRFSAQESVYESEVWLDLATSQSLHTGGSNMLSVVWITLSLDASPDSLRQVLYEDPRYPVQLLSEAEVIEQRQGARLEAFQNASLAFGSLLLAMSVLMSIALTLSIAGHCVRNIAILQILSFGPYTVSLCVVAVLLVLVILGVLLGGALSLTLVDGLHSSTVDGYGLQTSFRFDVNWHQMFVSGLAIIVVTIISGLSSAGPAMRVAGRTLWQR